ncbi:hypothetical protein [Burkholderia sp. TSV86]|uniref:hypothetical protein n=1 Tax=Burkholderia sp. TSV86 TaxID=1385594 RepID=UPI0007593424|nr:hypothetical protein [Burkholderia sp. TSV86]KVE38022.1 hypothetical protein WS68_24945 [Burkholderia sp. TSV86]
MHFIHLQNSDLVLIVALALGCALLLAARFRPRTWLGVAGEALVANLMAIAAIVVLELLLA